MIRVYRNPKLPPLRLNEQFLLPWYVQVPPNLPVCSLTIELTTKENLDAIEVLPPQQYKLYPQQVTSGQPISVHTPLRFQKPGHYAVRLRVSLSVATAGVLQFDSEDAITLHLSQAGEKLVLNIESEGSVLVDADSVRGYAEVNVKARGPVLADLSPLPTLETQLNEVQQVQVARFQAEHGKDELPMVATPWSGPDLALFWEGWRQWFGNQQPMREMTLLSADGGSAHPVRISRNGEDGTPVKLKLMTQHPGSPSHLFLLSQSAEGTFMQCAPNEHGQVTMSKTKALHYPQDFFGDLRNDDGDTIDLRYDRAGKERFLAVVTSERLVDPVSTLQLASSDADEATNLHLPPLTVSTLLNTVWNHRQFSPQPPQMEIGFLEFDVVE